MFGHKSPDWLVTPNGTNAICEVKDASDLAPETVDFQCKAANGRIDGRSLDLRGDPLIAGLA